MVSRAPVAKRRRLLSELLHESDDLLAVDKPAGIGTHRADTHAQDGVHEWLQRRRGEALGIHQRLDNQTSGVLVFGRSKAGNARLSQAFSQRQVDKRYRFLAADRGGPARRFCDDRIKKPRRDAPDLEAETHFERLEQAHGYALWEARPTTGRTHQVRLHAARVDLPLVGDSQYGGPPGARLFLHARSLRLPAQGDAPALELESPTPAAFAAVLAGAAPGSPRVAAQAALDARQRLFGAGPDEAYLWVDRQHDGFPEVRVERLGRVAHVLRYDERSSPLPRGTIKALAELGAESVVVRRRPRQGPAGEPEAAWGEPPPGRFEVTEGPLRLLCDVFQSPTSSGLFLDQKETRFRLLTDDLVGKTVLNAFAHTGSLSLAAAQAGAWTLTQDLSQGYLDWARENLRLNGHDPAEHDFVYGDARDWLKRFKNKGRTFDRVLLDPPSFSTGRSKHKGKHKTWSVARDLGGLVAQGAALLAPAGRLYVSTNLAKLKPERFLELVQDGLREAGRPGQVELVGLPPDYRSGAGDPPYLKAAWVQT